MIKNKRGQGLSTNAIILIVLGVIVLVILALGFIMGWDKIAPWIFSSNNVDTIAQQCSVACTTGSTYDYCTLPRELKFKDSISGLKSGTKYKCVDLVNKNIGVEACPSLCSPVVE